MYKKLNNKEREESVNYLEMYKKKNYTIYIMDIKM